MTSTFCPQNRLGGAIQPVVRMSLQTSIDSSIADGTTNVLFKFLGLDDLTGASDPVVNLGQLDATPVTSGTVPYDGTSDLDWWYTVHPASIDGNRDPLSSLNAYISAQVLNAGPGPLTLPLLGGVMRLSSTGIRATIGASSAPTLSTGSPPGHLASERLDPTLASFGSTGGATSGELCGNVSAASLSQIPIPATLAQSCTQYSAANSLLDLFVGGCIYLSFPIVTAIQPDAVNPAAAVAGAGGPYSLQANTTSRVVTTCRDRNNSVVPLSACLEAAAFSCSFRFSTGRVIAR